MLANEHQEYSNSYMEDKAFLNFLVERLRRMSVSNIPFKGGFLKNYQSKKKANMMQNEVRSE